MIMDGEWKDYEKFIVRTCLEGGGQHPLAKDNDCVDDEIMIVRIDNTEVVETNDGDLSTVSSPSKTWTKNYNRDVGNSALKLKTYLKSETALRYWCPAAGTDNTAGMTISSKYVGSRDIIKGWAKGHVNLTKGWGYDYGLTTFGKKIWGGAESKNYGYKKTWKSSKSWSKSKGWSFTFWAGPVPLSVEFGFKGSANVGYGFTLAVTGTDGKKCGGVVTLTPYVKPGASLSGYAEAGVNLLIAKGGVGASITIISGNVPLVLLGKITATIAGKGSKPVTVTAQAKVDLDYSITTLSGKVYAYAKLWKVSCKNWRPWSCSSGYKTVWQGNIFSFSGYTWKYPIYTYNKTWTAKL
jgi:hypothetical protein